MLHFCGLLFLLIAQSTVHAARVVLSEEARANSTLEKKPCAKCPVLGCGSERSAWSLSPDLDAPLEEGKGSTKYYNLRLSSGKPGKKKEVVVKVVLDMLYDEGAEGGGYASATGVGNCFAFATHQEYQIPGGSPEIVREFRDNDRFDNNGISPVDTVKGGCGGVKDECLGAALEEREGAFYLGNPSKVGKGGLDNVKLPLINKKTGEALGDDPDARYYLIAAFLSPADYHFWGLFRDVGWACVPSKAGRSDVKLLSTPIRAYDPRKGGDKWTLKDQCPGNLPFTEMNRRGHYNKNNNHVGYYLFPCRGEC